MRVNFLGRLSSSADFPMDISPLDMSAGIALWPDLARCRTCKHKYPERPGGVAPECFICLRNNKWVQGESGDFK